MSNKKNKALEAKSASARRAARFSTDLSLPMIFCVAEAVILIALLSILDLFLNTEGNRATLTALFIAIFVFYFFSAGTICLIYALRARKTKRAKYEAKQLETEIYDMFRYIIDLPYAIIDSDGKVKIMNGALQDILGYRNAVSGIEFSEICSVPVKTVVASAKNREEYLDEDICDMPPEESSTEQTVAKLADSRRYEVIPYIFKIHGENYYFVVFRDINDYLNAIEREERESAVVAYIQLDNLQELAQYVRADYRGASVEAENILKSWISEINGFIREYDNDKYVAVFSKEELDRQMNNDFEIQQRIMNLKIGDNSFPVTISMGIASVGGSFKNKEKAAYEALNIAVQRGGNQVAIKRDGTSGYVFFGGTHKTIENNTAIISRVSGEILESKIVEATNILIMGHSNPDFDSVGSCVGMARFAMSIIEETHGKEDAVPVNIVVDKRSDAYSTCLSQLAPLNINESIFIDKDAARDLVTSQTVLIICDVNNPRIYEAPELTESVTDIAVVDHHRLATALPFEAFLQYVETTKSSASEIVAEILFRSKHGDKLHKEEAEVLLSGIMLDTNNFTRNAGAQTFEITHYLYSRGAHTSVVREFFNESLDELLLTGEFESKARIYRDSIAITWLSLDRPSTSEDRVIAAKVADKLLKIRGVQASFALIQMEGDVVISGRSKGEINVQLILERLKGGGHFDIAGAQVKNAGLAKAFEMLKDAIDDYLEYDHRNRANE